MHRVFMIGWDGATFDLIHPWVAEGKLPTIARLMEKGVHGELRSNIPPMTFPVWSSFMTGKNPGKHGIYDFTRPRPGSYELEFVNGGQRRSKSFWQILSDAGRKVISISVPCTFPPEPVNGVMISGFDAPGLEGQGAHVDRRGTYPPEIYDELNRTVGHHPVDAFVINEINQGRPDLALQEVLRVTCQKAATAKYLMMHRPWDCFMILFGELDGISHHFWKYCDPQSPLFEDRPEMRDGILKIYQELDRQVADLLDLLPQETVVLMMSDHGFGGISDWMLYPNCWLRERRYLRFRGRITRWTSRILDAVKLRAVAALPGKLKHFLYRLSPRGLGGFESRVRYAMIDWSETQAYFEENPYYPVLWINLKGRQPKGTVEPGRQYEQVVNRLIEDLEDWRHPETGEYIVEKAFRREELYSGPYIEEAPDIIPKWALQNGFDYAFKLSSKSPRLAWIERFDPQQLQSLPYFTGKSGTHRENGILLAHGSPFRPGLFVKGARILDLAPTILYLLGVPVPDDMDGRVLEEIFTDAHTKSFSVQKTSIQVHCGVENNGGYSNEDEEKVAERLKALGYVE